MSHQRNKSQWVRDVVNLNNHNSTTVYYNPYKKKYVPKNSNQTTTKKQRRYENQLIFNNSKESDNEWIEDVMHTPAHPQLTRFLFQNCNGMVMAKDGFRFQHEIDNYISNIHFMSFAETRLNVCHKLTTYQIEQCMK